MKYYSNKNMEILSKYEKIFTHAYHQNWKEFTKKSDDKLLFDIYEKTTGEKLKGIGCPSCVLKSYKKIAELYFLTKTHIEKLATKKSQKENG